MWQEVILEWCYRVRGLLQTGVIKEADKPLWYDVMHAFPPAIEPSFERYLDQRPVCNILYSEDVVRVYVPFQPFKLNLPFSMITSLLYNSLTIILNFSNYILFTFISSFEHSCMLKIFQNTKAITECYINATFLFHLIAPLMPRNL